MEIPQRIQRLILRGNFLLTEKAYEEMLRDDLEEDLIAEAILNSPRIRLLA